ncbi:MAG TPA: S-methyl-5'-thioinosine phosphorylase [Thiobacillaceae bacterium]|nr:S-methyl-5'-thioinosine phosphorylase [Thiobacillaceae bacterium]
MLGIIGGTGLTKLTNLQITHRQVRRTPFGEPSGALTYGRLCGEEVVFLARHGYGHTIPPHEVNYRANIWAMKELGANRIVSIATVGGIREDLRAGTLAVPDQIIDYTHGRAATFAVYGEKPVVHVDFTEPYCSTMRKGILVAAARAGVEVKDGGVYAAVQGPRLETVAEINRIERDGGDMVGMTGMPEAYLARELGLCYGTIGVVINDAAGRGISKSGIHEEDIRAVMDELMAKVRAVLEKLVVLEHPDYCPL